MLCAFVYFPGGDFILNQITTVKNANRILLNNNLQSGYLQLESYFKIGNLLTVTPNEMRSTSPIAIVDANLFLQNQK